MIASSNRRAVCSLRRTAHPQVFESKPVVGLLFVQNLLYRNIAPRFDIPCTIGCTHAPLPKQRYYPVALNENLT